MTKIYLRKERMITFNFYCSRNYLVYSQQKEHDVGHSVIEKVAYSWQFNEIVSPSLLLSLSPWMFSVLRS